MIDYKKELNKEQMNVVMTGDGHCLVLAGAGTGKTRTIVYRVAYLLEHGITPDRILLVTFTNKAAKEMLGRIETLLRHPPRGFWGGTFHHVGHALLRRYGSRIGIAPNFTILDQADNLELLKSVMIAQGISTKKGDTLFPDPGVIENLISFSTSSIRPLQELIEEWIPKHVSRTNDIIRLAQSYEQKKRERNVVSFDDLLSFWLRLLRESSDVRQQLGGKFEYVLIDEYQDTNRLQGLIVEELAREHNNILVVGDDAQSIYAFRAATVENIMRFPEVFPGAKTFKLLQNYRSTQSILDLANASIASNRRQFEKELLTVHGKGVKPELVGCADSIAEARFVVDRITELRDSGERLTDSVVLFRAAYHGMQIELALQRRGVPYLIRGGIRFFEQAHIKDVISYLRVVGNPQDEIAWQRILKMEEGIGIKTAQEIVNALREENKKPLSAKAQQARQRIQQRIEELKKTPQIDKMINYVIEAFYENYAEAKFENARDRLEDLEQLALFAKQYEELPQFLADATLSEGFRSERGATAQADSDREYLVLSTIHQAKGLEWKNVFIVGLIDGQFPHYKSLSRRDELEEERRLFYVATTRAKERLFLTYPISAMGSYGASMNKPSLFVREVDPRLYKTVIGDEEEVIEVE
ncbi:MAG: ATP-dependent helicase [bacterium]|nr:ATP-dependent helicase [bacterium]